jgi:hypothetical protein
MDMQQHQPAGRGKTPAHADDGLPLAIPNGHVGPVVLPETGRTVWWTGRVAIGLRHRPSPLAQKVPLSTLWVQDVMLRR